MAIGRGLSLWSVKREAEMSSLKGYGFTQALAYVTTALISCPWKDVASATPGL